MSARISFTLAGLPLMPQVSLPDAEAVAKACYSICAMDKLHITCVTSKSLRYRWALNVVLCCSYLR